MEKIRDFEKLQETNSVVCFYEYSMSRCLKLSNMLEHAIICGKHHKEGAKSSNACMLLVTLS